MTAVRSADSANQRFFELCERDNAPRALRNILIASASMINQNAASLRGGAAPIAASGATLADVDGLV